MSSAPADNTVVAQSASAGWRALPPEYAIPDRAPSLREAQQYCGRLAHSHYENFSVVTWFLPKHLHQHFYNVYAYCRISDDLGDEVGNAEQSLALLDAWESELNATYLSLAEPSPLGIKKEGTLEPDFGGSNLAGPRHPVFIALRETIRECDIPRQPFANLLTAFRQDQRSGRYATFDDVLGYCHYSANPVGHLVLYLCGYRDAERQQFSDNTCTALQLANFWQDVARDYAKGRIYLPLEDLAKYGVSESDIAEGGATPEFREMMKFEVARAREWFHEGLPLARMVDRHLALDIELFSRGGLEILNSIERQGYDVLTRRPTISKPRKLWLVARAAAARGPRNTAPFRVLGWSKAAVSEHPLQVRAAYSVCRHIARSAARNFYYGFLVLPKEKRNAISAVYAFMRRADDISDDPSFSPQQRLEKLNEWVSGLRSVAAGGPTDDPVLFALADSQKRFNIPLDLLEKVVLGTAMDVPWGNDVPGGATPQLQYETFDQLYDYCYHVASVVGLVCIRIFGYRDPRAEKLAEQTGVAFQLTNILRDVREDAQMGRVYLPREDFARFSLDPHALTNGSAPEALRPVLEFEALRAREFYRAADDLLPLIDEDSQPALWTLVEIYRRLLERIIARNYDVFSGKVQLSTAEKLSVLGKGFWRRFT